MWALFGQPGWSGSQLAAGRCLGRSERDCGGTAPEPKRLSPVDPDHVASALERLWDADFDRFSFPENIPYDYRANQAAVLLTTGLLPASPGPGESDRGIAQRGSAEG